MLKRGKNLREGEGRNSDKEDITFKGTRKPDMMMIIAEKGENLKLKVKGRKSRGEKCCYLERERKNN